MHRHSAFLGSSWLPAILWLALSNFVWGQGAIIQSVGAVNQSMGGAAVAAPIDSIGALRWNPASISGMSGAETAYSMGVVLPNYTLSSSVGPFAGETDSDSGGFPAPNIGWVHPLQQQGLTFGLGIHTVAGFGTNLPADPNNPVLSSAAGLGLVSSNAFFMQISPVLSVAVTDQLSLAAGPTITSGRVSLEPFVLNSANLDGTYARGNGTRYHWGAGFQLGAYYLYDDHWRFGAALKSPSWMERFEFNAVDENGLPRTLMQDFDLPMILSLGLSYDGFEKSLIALDVRYFDFENTDGLGDRAIFDATGALGGLDHSSVVSVALGAQYELCDSLTLRAGYTYNQNPIKNSETFFNVASPLIFEHMLSTGGSLHLSERISLNGAYSYDLPSSRTGPIVLPGVGAVPGSSVTTELDVHIFSFGMTIRG